MDKDGTVTGVAEADRENHPYADPVSAEGVTTWDCVYFGNYYQDVEYEVQPIEWRVLYASDNDIFLLADKGLDNKRYNDTNADVQWANSTLRQWLNGEFINTAFSDAESSAILLSDLNNTMVRNDGEEIEVASTDDKVFLLSTYEAGHEALGMAASGNRTCQPTDYAVMKGVSLKDNGNCDWWLRTTSYYGATCVRYAGRIDTEGEYVNRGVLSVRPALHIDPKALIGVTRLSDAEDGRKGKYKLTVSNSELSVAVGDVTENGGAITVAYTVTDVSGIPEDTQLSVIVTDGTWTENGWSEGAALKQHTKLADVPPTVTQITGTAQFSLGEGITGECGKDYHVYVIAEEINGGSETDRASVPVEIKGIEETVTSSYKYDGQAHGINVKVNAPATGVTVKYGTAEGTYGLDASPAITKVDEGPKTVYYQISAPGYLPKKGSAALTITKTDPVVTIPKAVEGLTESGAAQALAEEGSVAGGTMYYAVTKKGEQAPAFDGTSGAADRKWRTAIPTATEAGTYNVWYEVVGDGNHNDTEAKMIEVKIAEKKNETDQPGNQDDPDNQDPAAKVPASSISLNTASAVMKKGETLALTATLLPENVTERDVVWTVADYADSTKAPAVTVAKASTADPAKANISEATVTANDTGQVIVTAATKDGKFAASCEILVISDKLSQETADKIEPDKQYSDDADKPAAPAPVIPDPVKVKEGMNIPLTYDSAAVTYDGKKADPEEQFGAKTDLSALAADLTIKDTTKTINDLVKVSWAVSGKNKGNRYFYPKLTVTSAGKSSAVLSSKDKKTLKSRVKKANKALKKSGKCKFTVNKRSLTDGTLSVKVQMKNGVIKKNRKKGIAKVNYVKLKISDTETLTLKNGKDCKVTLIDAESCLVKVEAKKNSNFTGSVTLYVDKQ